MRFKFLILLWLTLLTFPAYINAQTSVDGIQISDGETFTLDKAAGHENLILGQLIMGRNSTLVVPSDFRFWNVYIQEVEANVGARIVAIGRDGTDSLGTPSTPSTNPKCSRKGAFGKRGIDSPRGQNGGHGVPLLIQMGIKQIEALEIIADGGDGGASGNGGQGGKGGRGSCNRRCNGETGGSGGHARQSSGGDGGSIRLKFWFVEGAGGGTNPTPGISLSSVGGNTGPIGNPGAGGFGGSRKSCPWPLTNRAGGKQGSPGSFERGQHGRNGVIRFYEVPKTESHRLFEALDAAKLLETE